MTLNIIFIALSRIEHTFFTDMWFSSQFYYTRKILLQGKKMVSSQKINEMCIPTLVVDGLP